MSNVITSIGVEFYVGYTQSAKDKPKKSDLKKLPNIVKCSDFDAELDTVTQKSYDSLGLVTHLPNSIDMGGAQYLTANLTENREVAHIWNLMVDRYNEGNYVWLCLFIPDIAESTYIPICPITTRGFSIEQQSIITLNLYYTIVGDIQFGEVLKKKLGKAWTNLGKFNGGQTVDWKYQIKLDDINKLFNNIFYLKGV